MTDFLKERHDALTRALNENIQHILRVGHWDFRIMEQEFKRQGYRDDYDSGVERILIFRLDYMGDFILTTPAIREIRRNYPHAFITLVVNKAAYQMAEFCPYVNEVIPADFNTKELWNKQDYFGMLRNAASFSVQYLWKRNYTLCICFTNYIALLDLFFNYLSGAKERVGYVANTKFVYEESSGWNPRYDIANQFLTHPVIYPKEIIHFCANDLYLLKSMGLQIRQTDCELWYGAEDLYVAQNLLKDFMSDGMKIIVGIGANKPSRKYPVEKYLAAFKKILLTSKGGGTGIVIVGGPDEKDDAKFLEENLPEGTLKNLVGITTWRVVAAIASLSDLYIGNDTGTMHIAAAAHIPVIAIRKEAKSQESSQLFMGGYSEYTRYYPWQTKTITLRPDQPLEECLDKMCYGGCDMDKPHCITQIEPEEIVDAYHTMIKFLRHSGIKRSSCPPIIRSINQVPKLYSNIVNP